MLKNKNQGFLLILVLIIISMLILLAIYFVSFIVTDTKITQSHKLATQTYYLAEAGIQDAIWKIINDPDWYNNFISNPTWQDTLERTNVFGENKGYSVSVVNTEAASAEITSTAYINLSLLSSQRIIKTKIYKSSIASFPEGNSLFTDNQIYLSGAIVNINDSDIYSNDNISVNFFSTLNVDGSVSALNQINKSWTSVINASALHSANYPPPPATIEMPPVDFDSADPNSFKNRADQIYTQQEFKDFLDNNPTAVLNGITYVAGSINIQKGINLIINGALACDGNFKIGVSGGKFWLPNSTISINKIGNNPTGLLSKKSITFDSYLDNATIDGLLYAGNILKINNLLFSLTVNGGIVAHKLDISSLWQTITINIDQEVINSTLGIAADSPVINIEHWEEEY